MIAIAMNRLIKANENVCRLVNHQLTCRLFNLHAIGYEFDFNLLNNRDLLCVQDNQCFAEENVTVKVIDQVYDFITDSYKYLHTVETVCGKKGILLIEGIYSLHLKINSITFSLPSIINKQPN
jgi:hypothetical protein